MFLLRYAAALILVVSTSTLAPPGIAAEAPVQLDWQDFRGNLYKSGKIIIAGQPLTSTALDKLKAEGVSTIVNLRTPEEMANSRSTPIAEADLAAALGFDYQQIPTGGPDYPYSPASVNSFAKIVAEAPGTVFLHCNSARRATHLWVAWLARHQGMDTSDAIELGRQANFGQIPLEGFLNGELTIRPAQQSD